MGRCSCENKKPMIRNIFLKNELEYYEPIENVVLDDEEQIEHDREETQSEFGGITKQGIPVI
jgi:hypothetical protein